MLTIAAPCTLPVLPILLGASIGQRAGTRPAFIAAGFVASFASVALALSRAFPEKRAAKRCLSVVTAKCRNYLLRPQGCQRGHYGDSALNCSACRDQLFSGADGFGPRLLALRTRPVRFSTRARKRSPPSGRPMLSAARLIAKMAGYAFGPNPPYELLVAVTIGRTHSCHFCWDRHSGNPHQVGAPKDKR